MLVRPVVALALLALALGAGLSACNNDNIHNQGSIGVSRFHSFANNTDTFLVDGATGDLWKLDEASGTDSARWVHYAEAPDDVKAVDLRKFLRPHKAEENEAPAEEPKDEPQDGGDDQEGQGG